MSICLAFRRVSVSSLRQVRKTHLSLMASMSTSMKAVVIHEYGNSSKLSYEDVPIPEPGPDEVRDSMPLFTLAKIVGRCTRRNRLKFLLFLRDALKVLFSFFSSRQGLLRPQVIEWCLLELRNDDFACVRICIVGKIPAQSYTKLYIQFLDRVNNDKTINYNWENRFVLQ